MVLFPVACGYPRSTEQGAIAKKAGSGREPWVSTQIHDPDKGDMLAKASVSPQDSCDPACKLKSCIFYSCISLPSCPSIFLVAIRAEGLHCIRLIGHKCGLPNLQKLACTLTACKAAGQKCPHRPAKHERSGGSPGSVSLVSLQITFV